MNNSTINASLGSSLMKFTFTDSDGEVLASFRMNPGDIKLAHRCQEVSSYFENLGNNTPEHATIEDAILFTLWTKLWNTSARKSKSESRQWRTRLQSIPLNINDRL